MAFTAERRETSGTAPATTLAVDIIAGSTSIIVADATGWPTGAVGPFFIGIDRGHTEEHVKIQSRLGNTLTVAASGRGYEGTPANAHTGPVTVEHVILKTDIDESNSHIADTTNDHHTQYLHIANARTVSAAHIFAGRPIFKSGAGSTPQASFRNAAAAAGEGLNVTAFGAASSVLATGAEYDGSASTARASTAGQAEFAGGAFAWYVDSTLTSGVGYTRTKRMNLDGSGVLSFPGGTLARTGQIQIPFASGYAIGDGASAYSRFAAYTPGVAMFLANASYDGTNFVRDTVGAGAARLDIDTSGTLHFYNAGVAANPITWLQKLDLNSAGSMSVVGDRHQFGVGSLGAPGCYIGLGDYGNTAFAMVQALGSPADVALVLQSKGVAEIVFSVGSGAHTPFKVGYPGSAMAIGFFDQVVQTKQTVTGSRGGNAALASLITALENYGLITNSST